MKKFIITIDTEGDDLWSWKQGKAITTENVKYLPRFQDLCNTYGFKPVWLTNYEMLQDPRYVEFISKVEQDNQGELGMHLHAWSTPPNYEINAVQEGAPYLIEYPENVIEEKIAVMTESIKKIGVTPLSHRAGRWAMNDMYFQLLIKYGYKIDCSVTPHIDWSSSLGATFNAKGSNYSSYPEEPYWIIGNNGDNLLEVPLSIRKTHKLILNDNITIRGMGGGIYRAIKGSALWLRPNGYNFKSMIRLADIIRQSQSDYIMFMLHSSELMPNGSPTFRTVESIENLYETLTKLFDYCSRYFCGSTLKEYYSEKK